MYALAFYPEEDETLAVLDRKLRDWLGRNATPGSWDTAWHFSNVACPSINEWNQKNYVRALINDNDAAMAKLSWAGKVKIIGAYPKYMALTDLNLTSSNYVEIKKFLFDNECTNRIWTDGIMLYYTDEADLVFLKMRYG